MITYSAVVNRNLNYAMNELKWTLKVWTIINDILNLIVTPFYSSTNYLYLSLFFLCFFSFIWFLNVIFMIILLCELITKCVYQTWPQVDRYQFVNWLVSFNLHKFFDINIEITWKIWHVQWIISIFKVSLNCINGLNSTSWKCWSFRLFL